MATICAKILAEEPYGYKVQLQRVTPFARRLHIDLMDGKFAEPMSVGLRQISWPNGVLADLHLMYRKPQLYLELLVEARPHLVIVHAEAEGNFMTMASELHRAGIRVGVALLQATPVSTIAPAIQFVDHVLLFSGRLGHYGGEADLRLLTKVRQLRALKQGLEIGWDGGVNDRNAAQLIASGIDVLNVGGFIQHAHSPAQAYATLKSVA